ncbi:MAG TPA: alginate lyase family protein [Isosphaeraceae bacterium]|jgi:uncharacterized heparinase superfamily protein
MAELGDLAHLPIPPEPPRWRRYAQTVAHLRPEQMARLFARRVLRRWLPARLPVVRATPPLREPWTRRAEFLDDPAASGFRPEARVLRLLEIEAPLGDPTDWSPAALPRLWQLELNYFHWMPSTLPWPEARPWVVDWLDHAPRDQRTQCWNPFGVAQRVLRWTRLIRGPWWDEARGDPAFPRLIQNLYAQGRFLARHQEQELLGNHLLKTAVALYAAGRFFAGPEADRWLRRARRIIQGEIRAQILADGGHYERSPMYHLMVLVDLIDAANVTPTDDPFGDRLREAIGPMGRFAAACCHGDGEIPLLNDSVLGQAPPRGEVLRYAARVCAVPVEEPRGGFAAFPHFGLFRLGDRRSGLWLDAGATGPPFLQAHAHADTGSFELALGPHRVVCDSGVWSYQDPARRAWDRSTPAHSTVSVAGHSSSDCWGSFRVARRARIVGLTWSERAGEQVVTFQHDGFRHLPSSPRHERTVGFRDGTYTIRDRIFLRSATDLRCDGFLYLGPGVAVRPRGSGPAASGPGRTWWYELTHAEEPGLRIRVDVTVRGPAGPCAAFVEPAGFAPRFHTLLPGHRLRVATRVTAREVGFEWRLALGGDGPEDRGD